MYLKPSVLHDALLTPSDSDSIQFAVAVLMEKWRLHYPFLDYYQLDFTTNSATDKGETKAAGSPPGTVVDTLYGEATPFRDKGGGEWEIVMPHGSSAVALEVDATQRKQHKAPVCIPIWYRMEDSDVGLTLENTNPKREYNVVVPTGILDYHGITCRVGDQIQLANNRIEVKEARLRGRWKWTNIPLYAVLICGIEATGS